MKKLIFTILLCLVVPLSHADDFAQVKPESAVTTSVCNVGGTTTATLPKGKILAVSTVEATSVCYATTCASGGMFLPLNTVVRFYNGKSRTVSCRGAAGTGVIVFTPAAD